MLEQPSGYDVEDLLRDGSPIRIRAIRPSDKPLLAEHAAGLSPESSYFRFLGARGPLSQTELARFTEVDFRDHVALVATRLQNGRERFIGVSRWIAGPRPSAAGPRDAEVAFAVLDAFQGLGIGTLLLEHLAEIARRHGILELVADVAPMNRAMLDVFERSGLAMTSNVDRGVVRVKLSTEETEPLSERRLGRAIAAAASSLGAVLEPRAVALVGATERPGSIGAALLRNLRATFKGPIHPIHPTAASIGGLVARPRISDLGVAVDLAVIAVPERAVLAALEDAAKAGVRAAVIISAGFAETGAAGRALEERLLETARGAGMRIVGPNCMGVLNTDPDRPINATFAPTWPAPGNIAMLSQSGALGLAMLDHVRALNLGLSSFVSVGNKADVSSNDLLAYWSSDRRTEVIALYLESLGNPLKFARIAPTVARAKPIVAVKSGRSAAGTRAATSHSAALANLDVAVDALFAQAGVLRTSTLEEMFDVVGLLSTQPLPRGRRVGVITNSGGPGILLADACEARGLELPALAPASIEALTAMLPKAASVKNPVDMIASADGPQYRRAIEIVGADPAVDAIVVIYTPPFVTDPEAIAGAIASGAGQVPPHKPVLSVFLSSKGAPEVLAGGLRGRIPSYSFPENAALALAKAVDCAEWRARPRGRILELPAERRSAIRAIVEAGSEPGWLEPRTSAALLEAVGIPLARFEVSALSGGGGDTRPLLDAARRVGYPVVAKAIAPGLVHKSDQGGVALGLSDDGALLEATARMERSLKAAGFPMTGVLVQRHLPGGVEALVGVTRDPSLGPVVVAGLGGIEAELLKDASFRLPPVSDLDAEEMLARLRAARLFSGYRGAPKADRGALIDIIRRISALVVIAPEIQELDLNPVKVMERGAVVLDARIRFAAVEG
jgi:acetyl coenzyme A synthetase (ADP forming)-like protein